MARNRDLTTGRPVGAKGDGLGGGDESVMTDNGAAGELSAAAKSASELSPPSCARVSKHGAKCSQRGERKVTAAVAAACKDSGSYL